MTVYPQSYLPPKSQPWGRSIESEIINNREALRLNTLNTENNLRQLNSSVNLISRQQVELEAQQDYLNSLKTYVTSSPDTASGNVRYSLTKLKEVEINFSLSRTSGVLISSQTEYEGYLRDSSGADSAYYLYNYGYLNNSLFQAQGWFQSLSQTGHYIDASSGGNANTQRYFSLAAGNYNIKISYEYYLKGTLGAQIAIRNSILTVNIIN